MKECFETIDVSFISLDVQDIITTSNGWNHDSGDTQGAGGGTSNP